MAYITRNVRIKKQPLLSIAVPTKNRYEYLKKLVELYLSISNCDDIELVIQDNSDNSEEFGIFIQQLPNSHIRYNYQAGNLSVSENCDLAIGNCQGEYITMLGDDDGWHRDIINVVRYMKMHGYDSAIGDVALYNWIGVGGKVFNFDKILRVDTHNSKINIIDLDNEINRIFYSAKLSIGQLPCVYNGIVKKEILDSVKKISGSYFPGPSPDMANAIALALTGVKHIKINFPFTIAGKSVKSAGGKGAQHKHVGRLEDQAFLPKDIIETWYSKVPRYWTAATIYAQSALRAAALMGRNDLVESFNYVNLYGLMAVSNPEILRMVKDELNIPSRWKRLPAISYNCIKRANAFYKNILLKFKTVIDPQIKNIDDMVECEKRLANLYKFNSDFERKQ